MPVAATPVAGIDRVKVAEATVKAVRSPDAMPVEVSAGVTTEVSAGVLTAHTPRHRNGGR